MQQTKEIHTHPHPIDLSKYTTGDYRPGPFWKVMLWYPFNYFLLHSSLPWPSSLKVFVLRLFGARVGKTVVIKPRVRIKYPWKLSIGNYTWLGEDVWIDSLDTVDIGSNVCLSQGVMLLTGNHDYTDTEFALRLGQITLQDGVWIGAKAVVCPGVTCHYSSVLTVNSVATKDLDAMSIYSGNPATFRRLRKSN